MNSKNRIDILIYLAFFIVSVLAFDYDQMIKTCTEPSRRASVTFSKYLISKVNQCVQQEILLSPDEFDEKEYVSRMINVSIDIIKKKCINFHVLHGMESLTTFLDTQSASSFVKCQGVQLHNPTQGDIGDAAEILTKTQTKIKRFWQEGISQMAPSDDLDKMVSFKAELLNSFGSIFRSQEFLNETRIELESYVDHLIQNARENFFTDTSSLYRVLSDINKADVPADVWPPLINVVAQNKRRALFKRKAKLQLPSINEKTIDFFAEYNININLKSLRKPKTYTENLIWEYKVSRDSREFNKLYNIAYNDYIRKTANEKLMTVYKNNYRNNVEAFVDELKKNATNMDYSPQELTDLFTRIDRWRISAEAKLNKYGNNFDLVLQLTNPDRETAN